MAKERLALLRRKSKKGEKEQGEVKIVTEGDLTTLQDAVIKMMERKHKRERDVSKSILNKINTLSFKRVNMLMPQGVL